MTDREQYKKVFDEVISFGMEELEVNRLMKTKRKFSHMSRAAAAIAAAVLFVGCTGTAYAANVGGIQRTVQIWIRGEMTQATIEIDETDGSYSMTYDLSDGAAYNLSGGGVAFTADGEERALTEEEIMEQLLMPQVVYEDDGTVWVYYYDQAIDVTDLFEDDVCYVKLVNGGETLYLTIKYGGGEAISSDKYVAPDEFNETDTDG